MPQLHTSIYRNLDFTKDYSGTTDEKYSQFMIGLPQYYHKGTLLFKRLYSRREHAFASDKLSILNTKGNWRAILCLRCNIAPDRSVSICIVDTILAVYYYVSFI